MNLLKLALAASLLYSPCISEEFSIKKELKKRKIQSQTITEQKTSQEKFSIQEELKKRETVKQDSINKVVKQDIELEITSKRENIDLGIKFSFTSSIGNIIIYYKKQGEDYIIQTDSIDIPDFAKQEAAFILAFKDFINERYSGNLEAKIDEIKKRINESVESLIQAKNMGYAFRELGSMAAANILTGGLSGEQNKKFLQKIGSNLVLRTINDLAVYYGFSSNTVEGKIISEIIKVATGLYLSRDEISDKKQAIVEDVRASFYAQVAMATKMLDNAKEYYRKALQTNDYRDWREAYYFYRESAVRASSVLQGWVYLEEENFSDQVAKAFGEVTGAFIWKNLGKREKSFLEAWGALENLVETFSVYSDEKRVKDMEQILKSTYVGEAINKIHREAADAKKIFWKVDKYFGQ